VVRELDKGAGETSRPGGILKSADYGWEYGWEFWTEKGVRNFILTP